MATPWTVTAAVGDIVYEDDTRVIPFTVGEAVLKGDLITLVDGKKALTDVKGPFGVAVDDIANGKEGPVAVAPTTIYLTGGTQGVTAYTRVVAAIAAGDAGEVEDIALTGLDDIAGSSLEAIAAGAVGKVRLGFW